MPTVVGLRFRRAGRLYYFDPNGFDFEVNDYAVVRPAKHLQLARVVLAPTELAREELKSELKKVVRKGDLADVSTLEAYQKQAEEALEAFRTHVREHGIPITPLQAEFSFDGANLTFQFSAEEQMDFQELAHELADVFKTRVELRQVGPRDRARLVEGLGRCGLSLCCSTWLVEPGNVTVKMAKDQNLPLNPSKISGVCGRLLCCLRYEHEMYLEGPLTTNGQKVKDAEEVQAIFTTATSARNRYVPDGDVMEFLAPGLEAEEPVAPAAEEPKTDQKQAARRVRSRRRHRRRRR